MEGPCQAPILAIQKFYKQAVSDEPTICQPDIRGLVTARPAYASGKLFSFLSREFGYPYHIGWERVSFPIFKSLPPV